MTKFLALALLVVAGIAVGCKKPEEAAPATTAAPPAAETPAETPAP